MVGSILHRHDNVHRQLAAFTELLRRVQLHYANDQLRQMLCAICLCVPNVPRHPDRHGNHSTTRHSQQHTDDVTSLSQLKYLVNELRSEAHRRAGIHSQEQRAIVNYFERFFNDLDRLRDLKRYFHERIYACLYEYYYQPDSDSSVSPTSTILPDGIGSNARPLATVLDQSDNEAPSPLDGRPLSKTVRELWTLNRHWDRVLREDDTDMVEIDDKPTEEDGRFAKITSIVPNWVEYGFRALQLAKVWWTSANRIYGSRLSPDDKTQARNRSRGVRPSRPEEREERDEVESLEEEVATLNDCANQICVELDSLREELKQARKHAERVEALYRKLKEAQDEESTARKNHDEVLARTRSSDHDCADICLLQQLDRASMEVEVAQYRVQLIQGDLEVESDVQVGNGFSTAPLAEELEELETQLEKTLSAKKEAEDRLSVLTTGRRTGRSGSDDRRTNQQRLDSVNITRTNKTETRTHAGVAS